MKAISTTAVKGLFEWRVKKKDNYEWLEVCYIISIKFINIDLNCNS